VFAGQHTRHRYISRSATAVKGVRRKMNKIIEIYLGLTAASIGLVVVHAKLDFVAIAK